MYNTTPSWGLYPFKTTHLWFSPFLFFIPQFLSPPPQQHNHLHTLHTREETTAGTTAMAHSIGNYTFHM